MRRSILLLLLGLGLVPSAQACPDLTGRYRIEKTPDDTVLRGIVTGLRLAGAPGSVLDLEVSSSSDGRTMEASLLTASPSGPTDRQRPQPRTRLSVGKHYDCRDGMVSLLAPFDDTRRTDGGYLEGTTVLILRRGSRSGLAVALRFTGSQRSDLYRYESARISVPLPQTRRTLMESVELMPAHLAPPPAPPPDPARQARERADERAANAMRARVIGLTGASIEWTKTETETDGIRLQLRARDSDDMLRIEDSLLGSDLPYEVVREPYWSGNHGWVVEILVHSAGDRAVRRPSAFRVEKELQKLMCKGATHLQNAHVVKTQRTGEAYAVRVALPGSMTATEAADCIAKRGSTLISRAVPIGTEPEYSGGGDRRELSVWRVSVWR